MCLKLVLDYYEKRFEGNVKNAFIHLVREIGDIALAIEKANSEHARLKTTEAMALLQYIASKYKFDLEENMQIIYEKKMAGLIKLDGK
jgi:hypothetical protein